jgi:Trypsin-like peptidase domain
MPDKYKKLVGNTLKYPYLVGITTESGSLGTGILVSGKFVLTCGHVLQDSDSAEVISRAGSMKARVQKTDELLDLALLELARPILAPKAKFTDSPLQPGALLLALGVQQSPGQPDELSVAEIELKFKNKNDADGKILDMQLEGGARPGYSGGPVVVERGGTLVCVGVMRYGGAGANITNALGLASIRAFLEEYVPNMPEATLGMSAKGIRGFLILTAIVLGIIVAAIAKWPNLRSHPTKVTGDQVIVTPPKDTPIDPAKVSSRQSSPESSSPTYVVPPRTPSRSDAQGNPDVKVWVNTPSNVYHCPGTRWYGATKHGEYMTQAEAQKKANRPAYGKVCP